MDVGIENMGLPAPANAVSIVKGLVRDSGAEFLLLELPNGIWGSLWHQGLDGEHTQSIAEGDYTFGCAFVGTLVNTVRYIKKQSDDEWKLNIRGLISDMLRIHGAWTWE